MKAKNVRLSESVRIILASLFMAPALFAGEPIDKDDLQPRVTIQVEGLSCPFCAYGLEKRIQEMSSVKQSTINVKKGTVEVIPIEGQHIDIDDLKAAVKAGGFTPLKEVQVELLGKFIDWNGIPALSIISTTPEGKEIEIIYVLKENDQLTRLKASVKTPGQEVFIRGNASVAPPLGHPDRHPYLVVIESLQVL